MSEDAARLLFSDEALDDRWGAYDQLRGRGAVQVGRNRWIVIDDEHVREVLMRPDEFSSDVRGTGNLVFDSSPLVFDDPPRHTRIRKLVSRAFTPRRVERLAPAVRELADALLDAADATGWSGGSPGDFVAAYADPLPVQVIASLLGVPSDADQLKRWSKDRSYVTYHAGRGETTPELEAAEQGCHALVEWVTRQVELRRQDPPHDDEPRDLLEAFIVTEVDGDRLNDDDIVGLCGVLLTAGNLTTTRLLSVMVARLLEDPDLWDVVVSDADKRDAFVEECLRLDSPLQFPIRLTTAEVTLGDETIPEGAFVLVGIGPAGHDAAAGCPADLSLGRSQPHLAFGHGIHFCVGAALARLEATVTLGALADRYGSVESAGAVVEERELAHRGYESLPVLFTPRPGATP